MKTFFKIIRLLSCIVLLMSTSKVIAQSKKDNEKISKNRITYANKSPKVTAIRNLPKTTKQITYKKEQYHIHKGRYYKTVQGKHINVAPPRGLRIKALPLGFMRLLMGSNNYYYHDGVYYTDVVGDDEYEIIDAPIGSIIYELPYDAEVVIYQGKVYYEYNAVLYKKIETQDGEGYEVVGQLED